jgi:hypothetical protein
MDRFRGRKYNPLGNILRNKRRVLHIQSSAITLELLAALAHVHKLSLRRKIDPVLMTSAT